MRCRRAHKLLSRRLDGAVSSVDAAALDSHLVGCAACRLAAVRLERAWHALGALEEGISAPDDWARIEVAAEARRWRGTPFWLGWRLAPVRAAAAGVLAAMIALGTTGGVLLSRAARAPQRAGSIESRIFAETLGELPWGSPAAGLAGILDNSTAQGEDR